MSARRNEKDSKKARRERQKALKRRRELRAWIAVGAVSSAIVAILGFLAIPAANRTPSSEGPDAGQLAPPFTITDVNGNTFSLRAQLGRVVLLDFMGSRCESCVVEMPHLVDTYLSFASQNFAMISIDVGGPLGTEDPNVARNFLAAHGGSWPIALDNQGLDGAYAVSGLPTLVVVDTGGVVRLHHAGVMTASQLTATIQALL